MIKSILVKWIKSFLTDRRHRVLIVDNSLEWEDVTSSVLQGLVLGPLLFTIIINDMPMTHAFIFIDDTCVQLLKRILMNPKYGQQKGAL